MVSRIRILGLLAVLTLAVTAGFAARSNAAPTAAGPTLTIGLAGNITAIDLAQSNSADIPSNLTLETLLKYAPNGQIVGNLVSKISHPNPFLWIYTLRKGIKFWDGNELTAADVANSINYYRYPGSTFAYNYPSALRAVTATGRYTVRVTLKAKDAAWPAALTEGGIFEKAFYEAHKSTYGKPGTLTMGTGPFEIQSFDPTSGIELTANPHYWGGPVKIGHVSIRFFQSETSMALAFRAGDVDLAFPADGRAFAATSGAKVVSTPGYLEAMLGFPTKTSPWNDIHVRRAVAYAVQKQQLLDAYNGGYGAPQSTLIPAQALKQLGTQQQVNAVLKSLPSYPYSLAKAKAEMAKSAHPGGFTADTLVCSCSQSDVNLAQAVAAEVKPLGIKLNINPVGVGPFIAEFSAADKSTTPLFIGGSGSVGEDPGTLYDYLIGSKNIPKGGYNMTNYGPPKVDTLIAEGFAASVPSKRLAIYGKLLTQLNTDLPYLPLFTLDTFMALSPKFSWPTFTDFNGAYLHAGAFTNLIIPNP